jgi:UDP-2,3-diacylglucosamine hydrolase
MKERNSQTLLRFLLQLKKEAEQSHRTLLSISQETTDNENLPEPFRLFLVGDVFDLWIGSHSFFVKRFQALVDVMAALVEAGVEVHYFEGNHDLYLADFWSRLGVVVHENEQTFEVYGLQVRVEHGDRINPDDKGYLFLRWFLRTSVLKWLARSLPAFLISFIGERASAASRQYTSTTKEVPQEKMREMIRAYAQKMSEAKGASFQLLISGHVHVQDDFILQNGATTLRSINLGSWFDEPKVLVVQKESIEFQKL